MGKTKHSGFYISDGFGEWEKKPSRRSGRRIFRRQNPYYVWGDIMENRGRQLVRVLKLTGRNFRRLKEVQKCLITIKL